jgi:segregation and condensation protein B
MPTETLIQKHARLLEAFLFWKGEPVTVRDLSRTLDLKIEEVEAGLDLLAEEKEAGRGIVLVRFQDKVTLGTHPDTSEVIEALTKEELSRDLGKSALETLAIILYQGPVKRSQIDYVRGVNSQFIFRNLLIRGLIDRTVDKDDERTFVYSPSLELLAHLGVSDISQLPDFEKVIASLQAFEKEE